MGLRDLERPNLLEPRDSQDCFLIAEHIHLETVECKPKSWREGQERVGVHTHTTMSVPEHRLRLGTGGGRVRLSLHKARGS